MDISFTQDLHDPTSMPSGDLSEYLGDLDMLDLDLESFQQVNQYESELITGDSADPNGFDLLKMVEGDVNPATGASLGGVPAPPCAVRVLEPYHLSPFVNSDEIEPFSPEMISVQTTTLEPDEHVLKPSGNYLDPTSGILQEPACGGLMVQPHSLTPLQPALTGIVVQGNSGGPIQPALRPPMIQVNRGDLIQSFPSGFMTQDSSMTYVQPVSREDFINPSSGANQQTVTSSNSPFQPVSPAQPISIVVLGSPSPVDSVQSSNTKSETKTLLQELSVGPKKRGRKPKYPDGMRPKRNRPKKIKAYEMGPLENPEDEKRRLNALLAKAHRDKVKEERKQLEQELKKITLERDQLAKENRDLKARLQLQNGYIAV